MSEFCPAQVQNVDVHKDEAIWKLPKSNFIKVNFDAVYCHETHAGAWGFIARTEHGSFLAAGAGSMNHLSSALHAEAYAALRQLSGRVTWELSGSLINQAR
jgi:hypothetical protein